MFDTARLTRTISATKRDAILSDIAFPLAGQLIALEEMQHLMGALYDFGQMCPFLQAFRFRSITFSLTSLVTGICPCLWLHKRWQIYASGRQ